MGGSVVRGVLHVVWELLQVCKVFVG